MPNITFLRVGETGVGKQGPIPPYYTDHSVARFLLGGSQVLGWFAKVSSDNVKLNKVNIQGVDKWLGSWMIGGGVRQDAHSQSTQQ